MAPSEPSDAGPGAPDRAAPFARGRAWCVVGALVLTASGLLGSAIRTGRPGFVVWAGLLALAAVRPALGAWTMSRAPGRFVFVADRASVVGSSGRWLDRLWNPMRHGHWVHLFDAETERSLGWIEVPLLGSHRLADTGVAALFGDPGRRGRAVLTGPFRPVHAIGRSLPGLFEPNARVRAWIRQPLRRLPPSPGAPIDRPKVERPR